MSAEEKIAGLLARDLNVAGPMRQIFGDETGDALEVLLAQEIEHVAALLVEAGIGDVRQAEAERDAFFSKALEIKRRNIENIARAEQAEAETAALRERLAKVEALADEWERGFDDWSRECVDHIELRAALGEQP